MKASGGMIYCGSGWRTVFLLETAGGSKSGGYELPGASLEACSL